MDIRLITENSGLRKYELLVTHHTDAAEVLSYVTSVLNTSRIEPGSTVYRIRNSGGSIGARLTITDGVVNVTTYVGSEEVSPTTWKLSYDDIRLPRYMEILKDSVLCIVDGTTYWRNRLKKKKA